MATHLERLGPYRLDRRIGRGGMGTVYAATADVTGEQVAVKVLSTIHGPDEGFHDRFAAEIDSLRMLNHPNIVRILGYGDEDDCRFYAMELVDGCSLQEALEKGRQFTWQEATRIGVQICRALKHAHDRGIIHRDIKPANLLLTTDGTVKLSDFGIAKLFGNAGMTADGGVIGTAEYMAPEQADGKPATARSDLYSLGGVLYALLAGRPPFRAKSLLEMLQLQRFAEPEPIYRLKPAVPRALNDLVLQLLHKDPAKRMPSAMMTSRGLEAVLTVRGIEPAHESDVRPADDDSPAATLLPLAPVVQPARVEPNIADAPTALPPLVPSPEGASGSQASANGLDSIQATSDFRIAPAAPRPAPAPASGPTYVTRSFTRVEQDEHKRFDRIEVEKTPWISPQTWGLVAAMLTVGGMAWYWLQPPEVEALYGRISTAAQENKIERLVDAERDINAFLKYYPADRRARELQNYLTEIDLYRLQRRFEVRGKVLAKNEGLSPIERAYIEAIGYVNLDPALGRKKLQALVDLFHDVPDLTKQGRECLLLAQKQLGRLQNLSIEQAKNDRAVIEKRLAQADAIAAENPAEAERIRRAIVELYADEPWADEIVAAARKALKQND
jgi:serine/threonine-protein kinase